MHYEIDYTNIPEKEKETKAIKDCKSYLGEIQFKKVIKYLKPLDNEFQCRFLLEFQGIQGYPASVLIKKYWAPTHEEQYDKKHSKG